MHLTELFDLIRRPYIDQLALAAAEPGFHVEPVLRKRDGSAAHDGVLATPYRCDLVRKDTGATEAVDGTERVRFEPLCIDIDGMTLQIAAFSWDWLTVHIAGLPDADVHAMLRDWFLRWCDEDDVNERNAEGLYGVVHDIGDPVPHEDGLQCRIDLGSASAACLPDLIEALLARGASGVALG